MDILLDRLSDFGGLVLELVSMVASVFRPDHFMDDDAPVLLWIPLAIFLFGSAVVIFVRFLRRD